MAFTPLNPGLGSIPPQQPLPGSTPGMFTQQPAGVLSIPPPAQPPAQIPVHTGPAAQAAGQVQGSFQPPPVEEKKSFWDSILGNVLKYGGTALAGGLLGKASGLGMGESLLATGAGLTKGLGDLAEKKIDDERANKSAMLQMFRKLAEEPAGERTAEHEAFLAKYNEFLSNAEGKKGEITARELAELSPLYARATQSRASSERQYQERRDEKLTGTTQKAAWLKKQVDEIRASGLPNIEKMQLLNQLYAGAGIRDYRFNEKLELVNTMEQDRAARLELQKTVANDRRLIAMAQQALRERVAGQGDSRVMAQLWQAIAAMIEAKGLAGAYGFGDTGTLTAEIMQSVLQNAQSEGGPGVIGGMQPPPVRPAPGAGRVGAQTEESKALRASLAPLVKQAKDRAAAGQPPDPALQAQIDELRKQINAIESGR